MSTARTHRFIAGVADVYFLALSLGPLAAVYTAITQHALSTFTVLSGFALAIVASVTYHAVFAARLHWLTPGERMHGAVLKDGAKQWTNQYGRNRWALFALNLVALVLLGNQWDGLGEGNVYGYGEIVDWLSFSIAVVIGIVALGAGRTVGVIGPLMLYIVLGAGTLRLAAATAVPQAVRGTALVFLALGAVHLAVALWYSAPARSRTSL